MSDIVRRLRLSNGIMLDAEREEAADEIERLRSMVKYQDDVESGLAAKDAEIERLRKSLLNHVTIINVRGQEIERLREQNAELWEALAARGTEIERLRKELKAQSDAWHETEDQNERLRELVGDLYARVRAWRAWGRRTCTGPARCGCSDGLEERVREALEKKNG